mmetsp:Transcript_62159/g.136111  ORF Transcript_62159/g.136111 Transcript_62159/m.136111 type:complete len:149 (+) Transcript_62159:58-504(+)
MQIFVKALSGATVAVEVGAEATAADVAEIMAEREGVPADVQRLVFGGRQVEGALEAAGISHGASVETVLRLMGGGKVHGSLARAGKVKTSTPKVPKQEKVKKKLNGRAKKRWMFNRRFVNVVKTPGGKRLGPNNNAERIRKEEERANR